MENLHLPEILCPVGNKEMLMAAVRSGADAVYLGGEDFNARRNAQNFTEQDIADAVEYCHIRGVKVYLTLNIILSDDELPRALRLAQSAYICGVDGVIIADLGLTTLIRKYLPNLALHASTQMTVHTPAAIPFLKKLGIKRIVLARELDQTAIKDICDAAHKEDIEVEVFVHGALCMSVSGQCLLSSMLGGRSGNRGLCAGPCRLPFAAPNGSGYDLSLKDLSLIKHIQKLKQIGVDSFKIEGRMKRPEYVAIATKTVKAATENRPNDDYERMLNDVFSRSGFTDRYFLNKKTPAMFGVRTKDDVNASAKIANEIHSLYRNENQRVKLSGTAEIKKNRKISLSLFDGKHTATAYGSIPEAAIKRSIDKDTAVKSLAKLGGTPYYIDCLECDIDDGLSVSASALNELRRSCVEKLSELRIHTKSSAPTPSYLPKRATKKEGSPQFFCRFDSPNQIPDNIDETIPFSIPAHFDVPEKIPNMKNEKWVELPRWINDDRNTSQRLAYFKQKGFVGAVYSNIAQIIPIQNAGMKAMASFCMNVYNGETASLLESFKTDKILLSSEISLDDAKKLYTENPKGIVAYGNLPLMLTVNCPIKNGMSCRDCGRRQALTDRKGINFPVRCQNGYSEVLNSRPIYLADRMDELNDLDFITLYFTDETPQQVQDIIYAYKNKKTPDIEYTRGMYYRITQ